jgi:hypothetical protein
MKQNVKHDKEPYITESTQTTTAKFTFLELNTTMIDE